MINKGTEDIGFAKLQYSHKKYIVQLDTFLFLFFLQIKPEKCGTPLGFLSRLNTFSKEFLYPLTGNKFSGYFSTILKHKEPFFKQLLLKRQFFFFFLERTMQLVLSYLMTASLINAVLHWPALQLLDNLQSRVQSCILFVALQYSAPFSVSIGHIDACSSNVITCINVNTI